MKVTLAGLAGIGLLLAVLATVAAPGGTDKAKGIFAPLEKGQKVRLKESAGHYELGVMPGIELGHKIVEIGPDFVVVEDVAGVTETRIPIYSIRCITVTRLPKEAP